MSSLIKAQIKFAHEEGYPLRLTYRDIVGHQNTDKILYQNMDNLSDLLELTEIYGVIKKFDDNCVVISSEVSNVCEDFTIIPISLIVDIRKLNFNE